MTIGVIPPLALATWGRQSALLRDFDAARVSIQPDGPGDVAWRIGELPVSCRGLFERWLGNVRVLRPMVKMLGVSERVIFEYARTGDIAAAQNAELPLQDVSGLKPQLERLAYALEDMIPYPAVDAPSSLETGRPEALETEAAAFRSDLLRKIGDARARGYLSYREFEWVSVGTSFLADGSSGPHYGQWGYRRVARHTPEEVVSAHTAFLKSTAWVLLNGGMVGSEIHRFLVPVYVSESLDELEVYVPGAGNFPVEVVFFPKPADGGPKSPWMYSVEHDRSDHLELAMRAMEKARVVPSGGRTPLSPEEGLALLNETLETYTLPVLRAASQEAGLWAAAAHVVYDRHHGQGEAANLTSFLEALQWWVRREISPEKAEVSPYVRLWKVLAEREGVGRGPGI